jgi:prepilin-type N-terminal cleavage/methylation domain-containing protein
MMRARRGMTLLELTVAMTVTGAALGVGYAAFAMLADRRMAAASNASEVARATAVRRSLQGWLASARLTIEEDEVVFRAVDGVWRGANGDLADDDLTFFTSASTPLGDGGTIVRLHVERGDTVPSSERGLVAELQNLRDARRIRFVLDTTVTIFDVAVLSSVLGDRAWQTSWVSSTILPAGVRVTLSTCHPERSEGSALSVTGDCPKHPLHPLLAMPITASVENGR